MKIDHCLLAREGIGLADIREIFSHEQAISQCSDFLKELGNVKVNRLRKHGLGRADGRSLAPR
jgi:chorismate mutase/prephenate dehydratase